MGMLTKEMIREWMLEENGSILPDPLHPGVFSGYVRFTKDRAEIALDNNTHNRTVGRKNQLPQLKEALLNGEWDDNVDRISFDIDGVLSNGQHRLIASVETSIPLRSLVTWGVSKTTQRCTDRRGSRSLQEDLQIDGFKDSKNLAATARAKYFLDNGHSVRSVVVTGQRTSSVPDSVLYKYIENNKDVIENINRIACRHSSYVNELKINSQVRKVLSIVFNSINQEDADYFWKTLGGDIFLSEDDPLYRLHKRLSENAKDIKDGKPSLPIVTMSALIIKAWNFYERGENKGVLKYTSGGAKPEAFPKIYNPYTEEWIE